MSVIMWRTTGGAARIDRVECSRVNDNYVWFLRALHDGRPIEERLPRYGAHGQYHDTWEAAHDFLVDREERAVQSRRRQLALAESHLGDVTVLKKPADTDLDKEVTK